MNPFKKLGALLNIVDVPVGGGYYYAYCWSHRTYYTDLKHTDGYDKGGPRCPLCDVEFLKRALEKRGVMS